jgi:heme-degrading monooxygenase HmoA
MGPAGVDKGGTMHARVSFYEPTHGSNVDSAVAAFQNAVGTVQQMEGNQGATLLVDRTSGKAITITYWDTEDHLRSSSEQADKLRQEAANTGGLSIRAVESYEVAMEIGR